MNKKVVQKFWCGERRSAQLLPWFRAPFCSNELIMLKYSLLVLYLYSVSVGAFGGSFKWSSKLISKSRPSRQLTLHSSDLDTTNELEKLENVSIPLSALSTLPCSPELYSVRTSPQLLSYLKGKIDSRTRWRR